MRFFYLRNPNGHPIGCLATSLEITGPISGKQTRFIRYAVSVCNPLDQFHREQARALAAGRLATGRNWSAPLTPGTTKKSVLALLAANPAIPQRAREAARHWLSTSEHPSPSRGPNWTEALPGVKGRILVTDAHHRILDAAEKDYLQGKERCSSRSSLCKLEKGHPGMCIPDGPPRINPIPTAPGAAFGSQKAGGENV